MRSNPVYGRSLSTVLGHKIYFQKYPYMSNVEENQYVNCCVSFAFKYINLIQNCSILNEFTPLNTMRISLNKVPLTATGK